MKGLIVAGGNGTRLAPLTNSISKQLLPVYDKPLVYYPLGTLMLLGIREIHIVTTSEHSVLFKNSLGNGEQLGIHISYGVQSKPNGIPEAISISSEFIGSSDFAMILGDNIFHGVGLGNALSISSEITGAKIFGYRVVDPGRYGVMRIEGNRIIEIKEKPIEYISDIAITGLYFFENSALGFVKDLSLSNRNELEIVDLLQKYLDIEKLSFEIFSRGTVWLDTGTPDSLLDASNYVQIVEKRQGLKISCLEEIAWRNGWIDKEQLMKIANTYRGSEYFNYLNSIQI